MGGLLLACYYILLLYNAKYGKPPKPRAIKSARKLLCKPPLKTDADDAYYQYNLSARSSIIEDKCKVQALLSVKKRDTQSYITSLLEQYAEKLNIEGELITLFKTLTAQDLKE